MFHTSYGFTTGNLQKNQFHVSTKLNNLSSTGDIETTTLPISAIEKTSTITLLEHVNLNVPNHDYILEFYIDILGFGLDPRRAQNVNNGKGTVWVNCGASQFHLPFGEEAQVIPGNIGLFYDDLEPLKQRLNAYDEKEKKPFMEYEIISGERDAVRIVDMYGNVFFCRKGADPIDIEYQMDIDGNTETKIMTEFMRVAKQPFLTNSETDLQEFNGAAEKYGIDTDATECKGISYVEFYIPPNKAEKVAEFYECVFDAPTTVIQDPSTDQNVVIVGIGSIDEETGRCSQNLLFRESEMATDIPYDGHHIAFYIGHDKNDFEQAFKNVVEAQVLWVNPRFSDKVTNLNTAKKWRQFRFKNVTDLKIGKTIFELEHECRSIEHDSWPGKSIEM